MRKFLDTLVMIIAAIGCIVFTLVVSNGDYKDPNNVFNFVFLAIMVLLYFIALLAGFYKMDRITGFLDVSIGTIEETRNDDSLNVAEKVDLIKGYHPIDIRLDSFLYDLHNSQSGICDVEDYVNPGEVESMVNKWYLDLVPDIMTSMGILGTFIGLVWGMKSFDPSNIDVMTSSVSSLIDGIKVAFLTSIYGLVMSLAFNYSFNKGYTVLMGNVKSFVDRFHACIIPPADLDAQNRMVHNQKGQYEVIRSIGAEFTDQMSSGFTQSIAPTLKRIDESLDGTLREISENQRAFLQEVGESYKQMGSANDSSERLVNIVMEILQKNDEALTSQREVLESVVNTQKELVRVIGEINNQEG